MMGNRVYIFAANADELKRQELFDQVLLAVDSERRDKVLRIKNAEAKRLSLCAGFLLKKALGILKQEGAFQDIPDELSFEYRGNGKPYLAGRDDVYFNLSHSGSMVLCAICGSEIGCDIESVKKDNPKIAERFFTREEQEFVSKEKGNFVRMWTLKESFIKVTGRGLSLPLKSFSIKVQGSGSAAESISVDQNVDDREYQFREYFDLEAQGYSCSLCISRQCEWPEKIELISLSGVIN